MGRFTKIPQNTFSALQLDAGVLLNTFNPASPAIVDSAIITATTGGITINCTPTYSDLAEDVDNAPNNLKEFKHLDGWDCTIETTALGTSVDLIRLALGAADTTGVTYKASEDTAVVSGKTYYTRSGTSPNYTYAKVASPTGNPSTSNYYEVDNPGVTKPRRDLEQTDFADLWWVGDRADGGFVAVKLINALSTGGFALTTTKNGKGQTALTLTGHVSLSAQDTMPMEFYSVDPTT